MFNESSESGHPFLASDLKGKSFSFSLSRMMSTLSLSWKVKVLVAQLCDPLTSLTGSFVHGILQARILGRVAIHFFRGIFVIQGWNPGHLHAGRFFTVWATGKACVCHTWPFIYWVMSTSACLLSSSGREGAASPAPATPWAGLRHHDMLGPSMATSYS